MTHKGYSEAIEGMISEFSSLHLLESRIHLDLADWVEQIYSLAKMTDYAKCIIEGSNLSINKSLSDLRQLLKLSKTLEKEIPVIKSTWKGMSYKRWPNFSLYDEFMSSAPSITLFEVSIDFLKFGSSLINEEEKALIDDANDTVYKIKKEYRRVLLAFSPIVKRANEKLIELHSSLTFCYDEYSKIISDAYYDFLDENEDEIEDQLMNLLYNKYVEKFDEPLNTNYWAALLKEYSTQAEMDAKKKIIKECFSHRHAISISNPKIIDYLYQHCIEEVDVELFFRYFAEFAIIQAKAKSNIEMDRRKEKKEPVEPLPKVVVSTICDNAELNKLFRESLARVAQKIASGNMSIKWSHVKKVLEDDEIISACNPTDFGRMINEIMPEYSSENVRKGVANNSITLIGIDENKKYFELSAVNSYKKDLMSVGREFEVLKGKM